MALREFVCEACKHVFEEIVTESEILPENYVYRSTDKPVECPKCSSCEIHTILSSSNFALKGSGWTGKIKRNY